MSEIRFRFAEKRQPDSYATWIAETMARPLPRDQLLSAPSLVQPWQGDEPGTEKTIRKYLDSFTMDNCRVVLMAQGEEHAKLVPEATWEKEPWYGTEYRVERFKEEQVKEATAANDIKDLFLPGRNEFIPTNLDVQKKDVAEVRAVVVVRALGSSADPSAARKAAVPHQAKQVVRTLAQEGRPVLGPQG